MLRTFQMTSLILIICFGAISIFAQSGSEILVVAGKKESCRSFAIKECLMIRGEEDERWRMLPTKIENFEFVAGYTYILKVKPTANSKNKYRLQEIVSRVKVIGLTETETLESGVWELTRLRGRTVSTNDITLEFDRYKNRAFGEGGCNRFFANYKHNKNRLSFSEVGSTKKLCQRKMTLERTYFDTLRRVTRYRLMQNKLFLYAGNRVVLQFEVRGNQVSI